MTTAFGEVSKNQYPYRTLHTQDCPRFQRALNGYSAHLLSYAEVQRYDTIRVDYCKQCVGKEDTSVGEFDPKRRSQALRDLWAIQREYRDAEVISAKRARMAREVASLRVALSNAEDEAFQQYGKDPEYAALLEEYERLGREGEYRLAEVTVGR